MAQSYFKHAALGSLVALLCCAGCKELPEATVNGQDISTPQFVAALKAASGEKILQKLVLQRLISQEAAKNNIALSPEEVAKHDTEIDQQTTDPAIAEALKNEIRSRLLLRKLLLRDVTEPRLRELYELFKQDLAKYELFSVVTETAEEAKLVQKGLTQGSAFNVLAASHAKYRFDRERGGARGWLTRAELEQQLGRAFAEEVKDFQPKQISPILEHRGDYLVFYIGDVKSSFEDLKPDLEDLIANGRRPELIYQLLVSAKIQSPYLVDPRKLPSTTLYQEEARLPWEKGQ